jgi:translation initiation factor 1
LLFFADDMKNRMARKDRTEVSTEQPMELNNPFAGLQIDNLPLGDTVVVPPPPTKARPALGRVVLRKETAHRGGKIVIVVHDFAAHISTQSIEDLGRKLRSACGCGGTTRERTIEIQGNQVGRVRSLLEGEGFRVAGVK